MLLLLALGLVFVQGQVCQAPLECGHEIMQCENCSLQLEQECGLISLCDNICSYSGSCDYDIKECDIGSRCGNPSKLDCGWIYFCISEDQHQKQKQDQHQHQKQKQDQDQDQDPQQPNDARGDGDSLVNTITMASYLSFLIFLVLIVVCIN